MRPQSTTDQAIGLSSTPEPANTRFATRIGWLNHRRLFLITLALAALIYWQFQYFSAAERGDRANWDYIAQVITRGGVPYRDVVNIKTPLSAYIGAAAIVVTRPFGLRDVYAIRAVYFLLAVLVVGLTFLVAFAYFESRALAFLAAVVMLSFNPFANLNAGVQPKTPMLLFGLLSLLAIRKDRPTAAGFLGMLSALSWQPGLLFAGVAGLAFSRYLTSWRDLKAFEVIQGAMLPLSILILYFWMAGALTAFYQWTVHFNLTVYGPHEARTPSEFVALLARLLNGPYRTERLFFYLAPVGMALAIWGEARRGKKEFLARSQFHAVIIAPVVYFLFCALDMQGTADLIPLLPFVGIYSAVALMLAVEKSLLLIDKKWRRLNLEMVRAAALAVVIAAVFLVTVSDAFKFKRKFPTVKDQDAVVAEITSRLEPGDRVFVHGQTELLVLAGLTNLGRHYFLDRGKDVYLDEVEPQGFAGWFEQLKAERPKIVALSRLKLVHKKREIRDWVNENYDRVEKRTLSYYVRRD